MAKRRAIVLEDGKLTELKKHDELFGAINFSVHKIVADDFVVIDENEHMICTHLEVDGFLDIDGGLVFL